MNADVDTDERATFPQWLVLAVVGLSFVPMLLSLAGVDLGVPAPIVKGSLEDSGVQSAGTGLRFLGRGLTIHVLLEWTAVCIAAFTVVFAVTHYSIRRDVTTPIIGAALCFAGQLDAFRTLALLGLTETIRDVFSFIPFTWALSRTYHACILLAGTLPFVLNRHAAERRFDRVTRRYLIGGGVAFTLLSYEIVHICAISNLPQAVFPNSPISRPWDVIPLVVYMIAIGFVLPRFHEMYPSLFAHGLVVSMVPNVFAQCHAAFGSRHLFDSDSVAAQLLKIVAYLVPLCGLILDYVRAHESDVALQTTREKLRLARDVQQRLLPQSAPEIPGFDVAGRSMPTEAVGGDYFDYVVDRSGRTGLVVGDVSGHELAASIVLAQTRAYLRALATSDDDVASVITALNHFLHADVRDRWFVTMFYARIDADARTLRYVAAGHEARIVRADGTSTALPATSSPLGMMDDPVKACDDDPGLDPGDVLLIVSDGVNEATAASGEQFGFERAERVVRESRDRTAAEIVTALFEAVREFRESPTPTDDVTVVVAKCMGSADDH